MKPYKGVLNLRSLIILSLISLINQNTLGIVVIFLPFHLPLHKVVTEALNLNFSNFGQSLPKDRIIIETLTNTQKSNKIGLAEAPTYEHKFNQFTSDFLKRRKHKNKILRRGEYKIKIRNIYMAFFVGATQAIQIIKFFWPDCSSVLKNYLNTFTIF